MVALPTNSKSPKPYSSFSRLTQLDAATTEAAVVALAREFLASLSPYDLARIPAAYRPGKLSGADDITEYAFILVRYDCDSGEGAARCISRLANFFSRASIQLSKIMAHRNVTSSVA